MPTFEHVQQPVTAVAADVLAVYATATAPAGADGTPVAEPTPSARAAAEQLGIDLSAELTAVGFDGALGGVARVPTRGAARANLLLVIGLGEVDSGIDAEVIRKAGGATARAATKDASLAVVAPLELALQEAGGASVAVQADVVQALVEGLALGAYGYTEHRSKPHDVPSIPRVLVLADADRRLVEQAIATAKLLSQATALARDLVNTPPMAKRPPQLAERVAEVAKSAGLKVKIWDAAALTEGGFGGILGVGQGSSVEPRMVELTYEPKRFGTASGGHVVLVGKGITFDSGGLSLKPSTSMMTMKSDMGGAAAVIGAMSVLGTLDVQTKVTGLLALAENMPGGDAIRVSDVLTHRNRMTVEVMNTDAEGRLVMADALAYGAEQSPDAMIDLATLTGAQITALGTDISGLMGTDDRLVAALQAAAKAVGEQVWHLPLPPEYRPHLDSQVADLKNIGKPGQAGTLVAGLFLKEFVADVPWAHLDIAGPAFTEEGDAFYRAKGGTGVMVRTLVQYLRARG